MEFPLNWVLMQQFNHASSLYGNFNCSCLIEKPLLLKKYFGYHEFGRFD